MSRLRLSEHLPRRLGAAGGSAGWRRSNGIVSTLSTAPSAIYDDTIDVAIGGYDVAGTNPFNGVLDEVRIYPDSRDALPPAEVAARYQAQPEDSATLHYYPSTGSGHALAGKEVAFKVGDTLYYPLQDHLGSSAVVTSSSGAVVESMAYYPYGATRTGAIATTEEKFTGQRLDSTGLYFYNARYYDPTIGRFVSADSIVQNYRRPATFNRYTYAFDNPLKYTDPSGNVNVSDAGGGRWPPPPRWERLLNTPVVELAVDAGKPIVQYVARVTKKQLTDQGEAIRANMEAQQVVSKEVGGAVADVGKAAGEGVGSAIARQGELIAANQDPRVVVGGPAEMLKRSAQFVEEASPTGVIGPSGHASVSGTAEVAAPIVAVAKVVPELMLVGTLVEVFYPKPAEIVAETLEEAAAGLSQYYYDEFWVP